MSPQILADDHTHVIRRRGCIGEVLFAEVSSSLFVSVSTTISIDGRRPWERHTGQYTEGEGETTTIGNYERGCPRGDVGVVNHGICPQPRPFPPGRTPESAPALSLHPHNTNSPTSSSSSRTRTAVTSSATPNSILTTSPHMPSFLIPTIRLKCVLDYAHSDDTGN